MTDDVHYMAADLLVMYILHYIVYFTVWNALPPEIASLPSLGAFKRALKMELFRRSYGNANYRPQQH